MTVQLKKRTRPSIFQVLLLDNDASDDVEVQEAKQVDFCQVKEHLKNGGSVFITSKGSQKQPYPKAKAQRNYSRSRQTCGFLFRRSLRRP
ncbi:MAG: hypothetical protein ACM3UL_04020 [Ignavibacteria bacterium]